jgi:hypothetical protein
MIRDHVEEHLCPSLLPGKIGPAVAEDRQLSRALQQPHLRMLLRVFRRLLDLAAKKSQSVLFCDHVEANGEKLFALACKRDLEGIVA